MSDEIERIVESIMEMFVERNESLIPLEIVIERLSNDFVAERIEEAVEYAQERFRINKVLDYPSDEWDLYDGYPLWHLLKLTPEGAANLQSLKPVSLALLRILRNQGTPKRLGQIRSIDAKALLLEQGFTDEEVESLWVQDLVDNHYEFENDKHIEWCRLIPENEKTEEYKKAEEQAHQLNQRKEYVRWRAILIADLSASIVKELRLDSDGMLKTDIIKRFADYSPGQIEDALESAIEDEYIEVETRESGVRWYHSVCFDEPE